MHMNKDLLRARFEALRAQLMESAPEPEPEPVELPVGFEHMTIGELNRWIQARRNNKS